MEESFSYYLIKYHGKHLKKIKALINELSENKNAIGIHKLRIRIKKLKAFYSLIESIDPAFQCKKYFSPFKDIAKASNNVRDLQIILSLPEIADAKKGRFFLFLKKQQTKSLKTFGKALKNWNNENIKKSENKVKSKLKNAGDVKIKTDIDKILAESKETIQSLSQGSQKNLGMHDFRKLVKKQEHNLKLYSKMAAKPMAKSLKKLDSLQNAIGQWHDNQKTIEFIDKFMAKKKFPELMVAQLREKIVSAKADQLEKIRTMQKEAE